MKIEKSINKACFLRFLGSVSRKIGVFFGDFFVFVFVFFVLLFQWRIVKLEFLSRLPLISL